MTQLARRQGLEANVVLVVRGGHDDDWWLGVGEHDLFERGQAGLVEVFDDLDEGGRVEATEPSVPVGEATLDQGHLVPLAVRKVIEVETLGGAVERSSRHVDPGDTCRRGLSQERLHEAPLAAA